MGVMGKASIVGAVLSAVVCSYAAAADTGNQRFVDSADHVRIVSVDQVLRSGGEYIVTVVIDPGFHINANPASQDYLIPTTVNITNETPLRVIYPRPSSFTPKFADRPIDVYQGRIEIIVELPASSGRVSHMVGTLTVQACTDRICLPPADVPLPTK
jgi:hypothetical protein